MTAELSWRWESLQTARSRSGEEDVLVELLGREDAEDLRTEPRWLRADIILLASLPYGEKRPMPEPATWRKWVRKAMGRLERALLALIVCPPACVRSAEPASPSDDAYGYESSDDPLAEAQAHDAELPTSCKNVRCSPPRVCRLVSMGDSGGKPHAYCLGPKDDLCKLDPELCGAEICRTEPGLCQ